MEVQIAMLITFLFSAWSTALVPNGRIVTGSHLTQVLSYIQKWLYKLMILLWVLLWDSPVDFDDSCITQVMERTCSIPPILAPLFQASLGAPRYLFLLC